MLATKDLELLNTIFEYDPFSGEIRWKYRDYNNPIIRENYSKRSIKSFNTRSAGKVAGTKSPSGYVQIRHMLGGRDVTTTSHHLAWILMTRKEPEMDIDHKDGNPSNNSWENLRQVVRSVNILNSGVRKDSSSKITGVYFNNHHERWVVDFFINGRNTYISSTKDFFEACCIRKSLENSYDFRLLKSKDKIVKEPPFFKKIKRKNHISVRQLPSGRFQSYSYVGERGNKRQINLGTYDDRWDAICAVKSFLSNSGTMLDTVQTKVIRKGGSV